MSLVHAPAARQERAGRFRVPVLGVAVTRRALLLPALRQLELGDDAAAHGLRVESARLGLIGFAVALVAVVTAVSGPIAFVALAAPQIAHRLIGGAGTPELVPVSTGGTGQPSFWVHGASGYANGFDELSRALGPDYPLYAFQARGTDGYSMPHLLEEMVDHYVSCVRMVQPHGPYVLGGYSFGGLIAMEMACRLSEAGETIRHLVMFDTYPATQDVFDRHQGVYDPDFLGFYLVNYLLRADEHPERVVRPHEFEHVPAALREQVLCRIAEQRGGKHVSADDIYRYLRGGLTCSAHAEGIYETFEMRPYDASDVLFFRATDGVHGPVERRVLEAHGHPGGLRLPGAVAGGRHGLTQRRRA